MAAEHLKGTRPACNVADEADGPTTGSALERIVSIAQDMSFKASQIGQLIKVCDEAAYNLHVGHNRSKKEQSAALYRIDLFHDLARSLAAQIEEEVDKIEQIEISLCQANTNDDGVR